MWDLYNKKDWVPWNWCLQTVVLEKALESPLDCKDIKPVNPKGNQLLNQLMIDWKSTSEFSLEGLMLKLKLQYFGHLMQIANSLEKTLMLGKIEGRRRRGWQNGWQHWLSGHEFEQTPGDGKGQGSLECNSPWDCKEPDTTEVTEQQHRINSERCTLHLLQEIHYPLQLNKSSLPWTFTFLQLTFIQNKSLLIFFCFSKITFVCWSCLWLLLYIACLSWIAVSQLYLNKPIFCW